ncbi:hypothetical protein TcBrA4_0024420 [Trypanosoma cruzi]|nr:hypothetical protein TcBrA4_0024420 [Trypanosoma cruzi]
MRQLFHVNPWLAALLVMFVIRLSSGCLVVTLTHFCSFLDDVVRADGAWATPVVVRDVPFTAQDASRVCSVVWKKQWALARKKASTKIPDDSRRHYGFSWAPSNGVAPCRGAGALVAYKNSATGRCCEHNGEQYDSAPRESSTPCPVRGFEAVCLRSLR